MHMRGGRVCKWNDFRFSFNPSSSFFFLKNYCPTGTDFLSVLINFFFFLLVFFNFPSTFWFQPCSPGIDRTYELIILNKVESVFFSNAIFFLCLLLIKYGIFWVSIYDSMSTDSIGLDGSIINLISAGSQTWMILR